MRADPGLAPAKVNLCLHVTGRRADGYHLLDSLAVFAQAGDRVWAEYEPDRPDGTLSLTIGGDRAAGLAPNADNLVLRAASLLAAQLGPQPATRLHLDKQLPVASGIGGGSADAAAALRVLAELWRAAPAVHTRLPALALALGADVPVCLDGQPARMRGIGEVLDAVALPSFGLLLANPGHSVATQQVFRAMARARATGSGPLPPLPPLANAAGLAAWLSQTSNDLQAAAIELCPAITPVLAAIGGLPGCLLARMSGSGATCFGVFATGDEAAVAAKALAKPDWWIWGGGLARDR